MRAGIGSFGDKEARGTAQKAVQSKSFPRNFTLDSVAPSQSEGLDLLPKYEIQTRFLDEVGRKKQVEEGK